VVELFLKSLKAVKRLIIITIGFTLLLIGITMIVLPGPAFIIIPVSLGILATEFIWAKRLMKKAKSIFYDKNTMEDHHPET
jgi:tellurite resistance protein TerC